MEPDSPVRLALVRISEALELALEAEEAWRARDKRASNLCNSADQAHCDLLNLICGLSQDDADLVEPVFTVFENHLLCLCQMQTDQTS